MTNDSTAWQQRIIDNATKKEAEDAIAYKCRDALSALGDPVVVAEALPELVDAADGIEKLRFFIKIKAEKQQEALLHLAKIKDAIAAMKARP